MIQRQWHLIDASGLRVGRLAGVISHILQGKNKPNYSPSADVGDYVVVKNCEKVLFSGRKWQQKLYRWHTGWPGGFREFRAESIFMKQPDRILLKAISGMLPKNKLRAERLRRLRVYVGDETPHDHQASPHASRPLLPRPWRSAQESGLDPDLIRALREDPAKAVRRFGGFEVRLKEDAATGVWSLQLHEEESPEQPRERVGRGRRSGALATRVKVNRRAAEVSEAIQKVFDKKK